ncbi:MAG: hypothetical protein R3C18_08710 [Planctomycetaceae bacterium]
MKITRLPFSLLAPLLLFNVGFAQPDEAIPGDTSEVRVGDAGQFRPAFQIEPLVHRFEARRGKLIPFEFELVAKTDTTIDVKAVAMLQQETGIILPAENSPVPAELSVTSQGRVDLGQEESTLIKGTVRVPLDDSPFHTFGVLVKNVNTEAVDLDGGEPDGTRLGIRFVTQYLLRCDISVLGARGGVVERLVMPHGELGEANGFALARVFIQNPTPDSTTFSARCRLRNVATGAEYPSFEMGMPCRSNMSGPERFEGRILGDSRIRMEAAIPHPLFVGEYELIVELMERDHVKSTERFPVSVVNDDFPAQNRNLLEVVPGVLASPGAIELSLERGGQRSASIELGNNRQEAVTLSFEAIGVNDTSAEWLLVRPEKVVIAPGRSRKVTALLGPNREDATHQYARLVLREVTESESPPDEHLQTVLVGKIGRDAGEAVIEHGALAWDGTGRHPGFVLEVKNTGSRHLPLYGEMVLSSPEGQSEPIRAGYGRWLLPGASDTIKFRISSPPPAGQYRAEARIYLGENREPLSVVEDIQFGP